MIKINLELSLKQRQNNIRTKDALHIACSVYAHSDYFITTDKQLFNLKCNDMRILSPLGFLNEVEG